MPLGFKRLNFLLFLFCAIFFSCKNEIAGDKNEFLSQSASSSLSGASNTLGINSIDLDKYDVKSGLGPVSVTECDLDSSNFQGTVEKFTSGFDKTLKSKYPTISSKGDIKFNSTDKEEIWYVFTNTTGENKALPSFKIPGGSNTPGGSGEGSGQNPGGEGGGQNPGGGTSEDTQHNVKLPAISTSGYKRGPGNINLNKSVFKLGVGKSGGLDVYFTASTSSISGFIPRFYVANPNTGDDIGHRVILRSINFTNRFFYVDGYQFESKQLKKFVDKFGKYLTIDTVKSYSEDNIANYVLLSTGFFWFPVLVNSLINDNFLPCHEVRVNMNYHQFIDMLYQRRGTPTFPLGLCHDTKVEDIDLGGGNKQDGYWAVMWSKSYRDCYNPYNDDYLPLPQEFSKNFNLFDNRKGDNATLKNSKHLWLTEDKDTPSDYVYSYYPCNYYDYENKSDRNAVYITNGELGFGLYIPKQKWFYPIPVTDGPQGRGYYVQGKLFKLADVDYSVPEDEYYDPSNSLTVNFFNNLKTSSFDMEKLKSNVMNRVAKGEIAEPVRLISKDESTEDIKGAGDGQISNLGDKVGGKQEFIELYTASGISYYRQATCKVSRKVSTSFGDRYLVIYEEDGLKTHPSDEEYEKIADLFLQGGLNNDIYDKITNVFGSEWGYFNQTFLKSISNNPNRSIPLIKKSNTITLFYTDIGNVGDSNEYISASYIPSDLYTNSSLSNQRLMIHVHAPKATGDYFSESIISLAREFERLIYDQYFSEDLSNYCYAEQIDKFGFERPSDKSGFSDYFFSFLAKVIAANTLRDKNYSVPASYNLFSLEDKSFTNLFGLDKYYLYGMDKFDIGSLNLLAQEGDDFQTIAKAVISSFAYYIYTNFGSGFIREYTLGSKAGLDGIVSAINTVYNTSYTLSDLLSSWSIATLNSSKQSKTRPYTFNYLNYFKVQGVQYPNIDFSNTQAYKATEKGVPSSLATTILNNSSACYKVKDSWQGEYEAVAPSLEEGLELRVIRKQVN